MPSDLNGIACACVTPLTAESEIDVPRLAAHIDSLFAQGCSFVSTFGSTGEGPSLSTRQKAAALRQLAEAGSDMSRQVPAIMTPCLDDAVDLLAVVAETGCPAALVLPPFYYAAPATAGIVDYIDRMAQRARADIDLLLYNIPALSRVAFSIELIGAIRERLGSQVVGVKDSTGDLQNGLALVKAFPDLNIFTGDDRVLPDLVAAGGAGMIGGLPNLTAPDLVALLRAPDDAALRAKAAARIAAVDANGGLPVIKSMLASFSGDAGLSRVIPPLVAASGASTAEAVRVFGESGYSYSGMAA